MEAVVQLRESLLYLHHLFVAEKAFLVVEHLSLSYKFTATRAVQDLSFALFLVLPEARFLKRQPTVQAFPVVEEAEV